MANPASFIEGSAHLIKRSRTSWFQSARS